MSGLFHSYRSVTVQADFNANKLPVYSVTLLRDFVPESITAVFNEGFECSRVSVGNAYARMHYNRYHSEFWDITPPEWVMEAVSVLRRDLTG